MDSNLTRLEWSGGRNPRQMRNIRDCLNGETDLRTGVGQHPAQQGGGVSLPAVDPAGVGRHLRGVCKSTVCMNFSNNSMTRSTQKYSNTPKSNLSNFLTEDRML